MSPSPTGSGVSRSLSNFCEVSSVSIRDAEGPGECGSEVFIAQEVDGIGDKGSGVTTVDVETNLGAFLEDFQTLDHFPQLPKY
jgi:hypothetical protein